MKRTAAVAFSLVIMSIAPSFLWAKGATVKITIKGAALATPIEITDPKIREFNVWAGPGVNIGGVPQTEGFIIKWSSGAVTPLPAGLQHYEVSFYAGCLIGERGCHSSDPRLVYVVSYDCDPVTKEGYVYLPARGEQWAELDWGTIYRDGFHGRWFHSTDAWERFVRPFIMSAKATAASR